MTVRISVIIVAYNMARELPRTIKSLSSKVQRGLADGSCELIIVDNGSSQPVQVDCPGWHCEVVHVKNAKPSPCEAINLGIRRARGELIGVMIDGARMASPGLLEGALTASRLNERGVISTLGFHLGHDVQMRSVHSGYNQQYEDQLLEACQWESDGYRLFDVSVFAGSCPNGWFSPISESNALFMHRDMWEELGGYDESFRLPGGGLANLDTFSRSCALPNSRLIILLGEGTFHQFHGGVATNVIAPPWNRFHEEYVAVRGHAFAVPQVEPIYIGRIHPSVLNSIEWSATRAIGSEKAASTGSPSRSVFSRFREQLNRMLG